MNRIRPVAVACVLVFLAAAAHAQERKTFPQNTDIPPIAHTDPDGYREIANLHGGAGVVKTQELFGSDTFRTKLLFVHTGILPPGSSIGEHLNKGSEEIFFVLDGPAQFTVNGQTAELPARATVLSPLHSSHGLYNHTDRPIRFLNLGVSTVKGEYGAVDYGDDLTNKRLMSPAPFKWTAFDRSILHPVSTAHLGKGDIDFRRVWFGENFETDWFFVDHCYLPPDTSIGYHQHNNIEEVYYVIEGTGRFTVNDRTFDVKAGDALPCRLHDSHGLYNNSNERLEILVFCVANGVKADPWAVNWGEDLTSK